MQLIEYVREDVVDLPEINGPHTWIQVRQFQLIRPASDAAYLSALVVNPAFVSSDFEGYDGPFDPEPIVRERLVPLINHGDLYALVDQGWVEVLVLDQKAGTLDIVIATGD